MSKKKTKIRQKSKKRGKSRANNQRHLPALRVSQADLELIKIDSLLARKEWDEARGQLHDLHSRYPTNENVLRELVNLAFDTGDLHSYLIYVRKLVPLAKSDGDMALGLAGGYAANTYPFAAYYYKQEFLRRFPDHQRAEEVRGLLAQDRELLDRLSPALGVEGEAGYELGYQHDLLRAEVELGDDAVALKLGRQILEEYPNFTPAFNNLSQLEFRMGNSETAIKYARHVLDIAPDNFQASANLTRYLYLLGHVEEATSQSNHLDSLQSTMAEFWTKKAETFTYLGQHARVDAVVREVEEYPELSQFPGMALLYHLGGVAALNMGDEKLARSRWEEALKDQPTLDLARENLDDLNQPESERHGPWPFTTQQWLPTTLFGDLKAIWAQQAKGRKTEQQIEHGVKKAIQGYFDDHPGLMGIFASLLAYGGEAGRDMVFNVAKTSEYPPLFEKVYAHALAQDGPDSSRLQATELLRQFGHMPTGTTRMWLQGKWHETLLFNFVVGEESEASYPMTSREARDAYVDAHELLRDENYSGARTLLERANKLQPDHPIILNNLAQCLERLGDQDAANTMVASVIKNCPDYLFGQISIINQLINNAELKQAQETLTPLLNRAKLHYSEFSAVADAQVRILVLRDEINGAKMWLDTWRKILPDEPKVDAWEIQLAIRKGGIADLLKKSLQDRVG